jgi:Na+/melibiose symporter-like transporter
MWFSLQFIFIDTYLKLGENFAIANIIGLCVSSVLIGFWVKLSERIGKKLTWSIGILIYVLSVTYASLLKPGEANLDSLIGLMILNYAGASAMNLLVPSLLADVIDYSTWKFGADRTATYFSFQTFSIKTTAAVGSAIGLGITGWYGFDVSAIDHDSEGVFGLHLAAFWLPIPILLITLIFIAMIPIDNRRHKIIRRRLDSGLSRSHQSIHVQSVTPLPCKLGSVTDTQFI